MCSSAQIYSCQLLDENDSRVTGKVKERKQSTGLEQSKDSSKYSWWNLIIALWESCLFKVFASHSQTLVVEKRQKPLFNMVL